MTKRLNGTSKGGQFERDPYDWYREPPEAVEALFAALDFRDDLIFDPSCGGGNILDVAKARGHATVGADIIDRHPRHTFHRGNYLTATRFPNPHDRALSVISNPPYNYDEGIGERFILKTLDDVPFRLAAFLMPIEFTCGQGRYRRLYSIRPPAYVGFLAKRPSMPPGAAVEVLGADAYKGGMADYLWLVWKPERCRTEALFLGGDDEPQPHPTAALGGDRVRRAVRPHDEGNDKWTRTSSSNGSWTLSGRGRRAASQTTRLSALWSFARWR